jgi:DNA-binding GntR family transcriptional regulator
VEDSILYHRIADSIRKEILTGRYKPGDRLPSVRQLCESWNCTPGTIQRAYNELAREGLLVSRAGAEPRWQALFPRQKFRARKPSAGPIL